MSDLRTPEVEDLLRVFAALDDEDVIFSLLEDLFTIREIKETSQRLAVARQLDAGKSYSAIEEATGASATTIARVSKCLSYGAGGYNAALNVLDDAEKKRRCAVACFRNPAASSILPGSRHGLPHAFGNQVNSGREAANNVAEFLKA